MSFERAMLAIIGVGVLLRVIATVMDIPRFDGAFYSTLGYNLVSHHEFMTLSGLHTYNYSLTFPTYLAGFYAVFGFSVPVTKVASFLCSLIVIVVAYLATKDLFDRKAGLTAAAVMSLTSALIVVTGKAYVENIVLIFFIPTIWAMVKGFKDSRFIPIAAFFAGLTYYTKTDVGLYIASGALAAFIVWKFLYARLEMFKDKYYWLAFVIVIVMILGRAFLIYSGQDQPRNLSRTILASFNIVVFLVQLVLHMALVAGFFIFFYPEFRQSLSNYKKESTNFLLLLITALSLLAVFNATGWQTLSPRILGGVSREYITIVYLPALWMFFYFASWERDSDQKGFFATIKEIFKRRIRLLAFLGCLALAVGMIFVDDWLAILFFFGSLGFVFTSFRRRLTILFVALFVVSANAVTAVYHPAYVEAADEINKTLQPGHTVALDRENKSEYLSPDRMFMYFSVQDIDLVIYENGTYPNYIISEYSWNYTGYTFVGIFLGEVRPTTMALVKDLLLGKDIGPPYPDKTIYVWRLP
ncbi:MAG: glycosyltransferase family 39 protein [Methanobacteriota archaeon]|nr:MAG: glycosyltransferase family 39 protein [Euryarchaeota archaeon]